MVRIVSYKKRESNDGEEFFTLIVQGGIEMIKSEESGNYYATARKASIASTFDEETCKHLIGQELPGEVKRVACEPYDYTIEETNEIIELAHKYVFEIEDEKSMISKEKSVKADVSTFSSNGVLEHA